MNCDIKSSCVEKREQNEYCSLNSLLDCFLNITTWVTFTVSITCFYVIYTHTEQFINITITLNHNEGS